MFINKFSMILHDPEKPPESGFMLAEIFIDIPQGTGLGSATGGQVSGVKVNQVVGAKKGSVAVLFPILIQCGKIRYFCTRLQGGWFIHWIGKRLLF